MRRMESPEESRRHTDSNATVTNALMDSVYKTQTADEDRDAVAQPVNLDSQTMDYREWLRFDDQGMVHRHSILGNFEDFRNYLEAKGETEFGKRLPKCGNQAPFEPPGRRCPVALESGIPSGHRNTQSYAHVTQARRQQDLLADFLDRPAENLLLDQADGSREIQEQRHYLNQVVPLIHSGYGSHVGSVFWSLPQHYGDEMPLTEQSRPEPDTHTGQPSSMCQESGIMSAESLRPASRTWSAHLQHQHQDRQEVQQDMNIKQLISGLEDTGSHKPFTFITVCRSPLLEKEEVETEPTKMKENIDPLAQYGALPIPALRFCGQLASWTGNSTVKKGEVGISATIFFEALTGEIASSHLELHNEGSTVIFYNWQQVPVQLSFSNLRPQTRRRHFHLISSDVIRPGETKRVEFIFKSNEPGITTEQWQLIAHPVLLQGASMQVTLRGLAVHQDHTADQRLFIETKLEEIVKVKMCRSIVYEVLRGVHTPERPSSPAELTEEQEFLSQNPKLQYYCQPVEDLKRLWHEVHPGQTWDLSVSTLQQAVLSLSEQESAQETGLTQLNAFLLQLSEPPPLKHHQLTAATIGQQLWRTMLDTVASEAMRLRNMLGLPERDTWVDEKENVIISDADEKTEKEEKSVTRSGFKDTKSATTEDSKKKGKRREEVGKSTREKPGKESAWLSDGSPASYSHQPPDGPDVNPEVVDIYKRLLHNKVYVLMEDLVNNLCDLMDELTEEHTHTHTHTPLTL